MPVRKKSTVKGIITRSEFKLISLALVMIWRPNIKVNMAIDPAPRPKIPDRDFVKRSAAKKSVPRIVKIIFAVLSFQVSVSPMVVRIRTSRYAAIQLGWPSVAKTRI